jgi:hypothetical protein
MGCGVIRLAASKPAFYQIPCDARKAKTLPERIASIDQALRRLGEFLEVPGAPDPQPILLDGVDDDHRHDGRRCELTARHVHKARLARHCARVISAALLPADHLFQA